MAQLRTTTMLIETSHENAKDTDETVEIIVQSPVDALGLLNYQRLLQAQETEPEHLVKKTLHIRMGEWFLDKLQMGDDTI